MRERFGGVGDGTVLGPPGSGWSESSTSRVATPLWAMNETPDGSYVPSRLYHVP